jgi:hypothetical protein
VLPGGLEIRHLLRTLGFGFPLCRLGGFRDCFLSIRLGHLPARPFDRDLPGRFLRFHSARGFDCPLKLGVAAPLDLMGRSLPNGLDLGASARKPLFQRFALNAQASDFLAGDFGDFAGLGRHTGGFLLGGEPGVLELGDPIGSFDFGLLATVRLESGGTPGVLCLGGENLSAFLGCCPGLLEVGGLP